MAAESHAYPRRVAERRFYASITFAMLAAVFLGFARTCFLKPWFPETAALVPPEPFFFAVHGVCFTAWMLLLVAQPQLVANRRVDLQRALGCPPGRPAAINAPTAPTPITAAASPAPNQWSPTPGTDRHTGRFRSRHRR